MNPLVFFLWVCVGCVSVLGIALTIGFIAEIYAEVRKDLE